MKTLKLNKKLLKTITNYQLKLPIELEYKIPDDDPVRLLSHFVEEMDLEDLYSTYSRIKRNQASPRQMLKILIYAYMNHIYSSRDIEKACRRDVNFMYLLEGMPVPDHATFSRFRSLHFTPCAKRILSEMSEFLYDIGELSGDAIFIDGTKIEACANKYTFVWKRAVTKNQEKLLAKLADFFAECEEKYGIKIVYNNQVEMKHVKKLRKRLYAIKKEENIEFVHGKGKRKTPFQRSIETLENYLDKLKEYTKNIHVCGDRNSFSKTDHDATFMRMKEDAMGNGQLKAAYNIQHGVDSEYITWVTVNQCTTDAPTLIPFLNEMRSHLKFKYKKVVADAGYESEENYIYLDKNGQSAYIKPLNYEQSKTKKYKNDIGLMENMEYHAEGDYYVCHNKRKLVVSDIIKKRSKNGFLSEKTVYTCEDCSDCSFKSKCIKGNSKIPLTERVKRLHVAKEFIRQREKAMERIRSEEGCMLRINRSIQAEGSFGTIKQDMGFRRFLCRGKANVLAESILLAMAFNVNKLHSKIQAGRTGTHLFQFENSA